jgi:hypothetical protein
MMHRALLFSLAFVSSCGAPQPSSQPTGDAVAPSTDVAVSPGRQAAMTAILEIDAMRSSLAGGISDLDNVTGETFAQVCKPVGMRLRETGQSNGWQIRQVAVRYRNPDHAPDPQSAEAFPRFETNPSLDSLWIRTEVDGAPGWRYLRRITVESSCLACHGAKESRPEFVKQKYLEDRAFGFEAGDLRGLYSVFVPDSSGAPS